MKPILHIAAAGLLLAGPTLTSAWAEEHGIASLMPLAQAELLRFESDPATAAGGRERGVRVIKGAPYCAEAVHETVQWLPDPGGGAANRIVRQSTTRWCRDGEGRTRQEVERAGRRLVYLRDPVAQENWVLDPQRKQARRLAGGGGYEAAVDTMAWQDYAERMREWARATADAARLRAAGAATVVPGAAPVAPAMPTAPAAPLPPAAPPVASAPRTPAAQPVLVTRGEHGEVAVLRPTAGAAALGADEMPVPPPAVQWRTMSLAPRGAGATTSLGSRDFEGVRGHGERTVWTIEAGRVGNERPIQIVREVWTSPELFLTLASRDFDPRSAEVLYRLTQLRRGEPEAELMRVPADYTRSGRGNAPPHPAPPRG